jgi:hypothetical protein
MRLTPEQIEQQREFLRAKPWTADSLAANMLDTIDALTAEKKAAVERLRAERDAARGEALREAAVLCIEEYWKIDVTQREYENGDQPQVIAEALSKHILALDPSAVKAAEEHKR